MKWKSHTAIARAIALETGLPDDLEKALCAGSVEPDKRPDAAFRVGKSGRTYIGRAPHHMPPTGTIMAYIWRARKAYLLGNDYWAVKSLGRALHYIQDKSVHVGVFRWAHDPREEAIAGLKPSPEAVRRGVQLAVCSPIFVRECVNAVRPRRDPRDALFQATLYSSAIFASVISASGSEEEFLRSYGRAHERHRLWQAAAGGTAALSLGGAYMMNEPLLLAALPLGLAAVKLDRGYYQVRDEAEWHGYVDG